MKAHAHSILGISDGLGMAWYTARLTPYAPESARPSPGYDGRQTLRQSLVGDRIRRPPRGRTDASSVYHGERASVNGTFESP